MPAIESLIAPTPEAIATESAMRNLQTQPRTRILSVSPASEDHAELRRIVDDAQWQIVAARTCREALAQLSRTRAFVVFCEYSLSDGTWKDIFDYIVSTAEPAPVIVTSRLADEYLWAEVLNLGGYDVLAKPFNEREVRHVLASAWMQRVDPVRRVRAAGMT
jgi:DNA-binding NtrC family response regulator